MTTPRSIWTRPERAARGPAPGFDRDRIAAAAVAIADADGLPAVTMRAVATALGSGPASLYRYVTTRDELLELMTDRVNGEVPLTGAGTGDWTRDLLTLARGSRDVIRAHPWLLEATATRTPLGPNAVAYLERCLAALSPLPASARTKLEAVGVLTTVVTGLTRAELAQHAAGNTLADWQAAQSDYLTAIATAGHHPHLAAAMTPPPGPAPATPDAEPLFDRVVRRVLTGLLTPEAP